MLFIVSGIIAKANTDSDQMFERCTEELNGERVCPMTGPCGPFYQNTSNDCKIYRAQLEKDLLGRFKRNRTSKSNDQKRYDDKTISKCLEQLNADAVCKTGFTCGPFYKYTDKECTEIRKSLFDFSIKERSNSNPSTDKKAVEVVR